MMRQRSMIALIITTVTGVATVVAGEMAQGEKTIAAQPATLHARFIGNMAFAIDDGTTTLMTDFPYQSGYSVYMTYRADQIRSDTSRTLALITHRHADHWERALFDRTDWHVAGPTDVVRDAAPARVVPLTPGATFGALQIEAIETPHANIGHYSYVVTWQGRRLYFSGDTESTAHLTGVAKLDVAFMSPWLYRSALTRGVTIDARRIVIYHHASGEQVPECRGNCFVPRQGDSLDIR
jgi:L-ascorbate metabolism protein UlaG (beta-lactamase superfamily)